MSCQDNSCETNSCAPKAGMAQKCCEAEDCSCPIEKSIQMWTESFCQAMTAVQVDMLKERIKKAWGPVMEKKADAIVQAMGAVWQAKLTAAKAQCDLHDTIRKIIESAKG